MPLKRTATYSAKRLQYHRAVFEIYERRCSQQATARNIQNGYGVVGCAVPKRSKSGDAVLKEPVHCRGGTSEYLGRGCARSLAEALWGCASACRGEAPLADEMEALFTCVLPAAPLGPLLPPPFLLSAGALPTHAC